MILPRLVPNKRKIIESVLFIIELAGKNGAYPTQYDIVKSIFTADLFHLKKYGRPVTFDNYSALPFGPVPSETYDMLKPGYNAADLDEATWPLWDRKYAPEIATTAFRYCDPKRSANQRKLSQTDRDELRSAYELVKQLGFIGTRDWTHDHPAYKTAWANRGSYRSSPMDYTQLVDQDDQELGRVLN
jgi:hypothetical protein